MDRFWEIDQRVILGPFWSTFPIFEGEQFYYTIASVSFFYSLVWNNDKFQRKLMNSRWEKYIIDRWTARHYFTGPFTKLGVQKTDYSEVVVMHN